MLIIDHFTKETHGSNSPYTSQLFCLSFLFYALDQIPKIKISHMVASKHTEVIKGIWWLIATDVLDPEYAAKYYAVDYDGSS